MLPVRRRASSGSRGHRRVPGSVVAAVLALAQTLPAQTPPLLHFMVPAGRVSLAVWARRPARPLGAILLVHGRTWGARPDFDLQVAGEPRSVLAAFAARGYAAYAVDLPGYGGSAPDPTGWDTPDRCAAAVAAVLQWVRAQAPSLGAPALFGWSEGATVSQLVAQRFPDRVGALVLIGYWVDPDSTFAPDTTRGPPPVVKNTAQDAVSDFITPSAIDDRVKNAYTAAALAADPTLVAWRHLEEYNALDPARVHVMTLLLQGEFDPYAPTAAQARFYTRLGTTDREWVTIAGGDHAAILENTQPEVIAAVVGFLERPRPMQSK